MHPVPDDPSSVDEGGAPVEGAPPVVTADEFNERVNRILLMMETDPKIRDRVMVETYVQIAEFSTVFRAMQDDFGKMGPGGILKMLRGKG